MSETPPRGLPGRRNTNPPAPIDTSSPGEQIAPTPLTTPPEERDTSSSGSGSSVMNGSPPITPPDRSPPLPTEEEIAILHQISHPGASPEPMFEGEASTGYPGSSPLPPTVEEVAKSRQITPPASSPLGPEGKELPTETINEPGSRPDGK